MNRNRTATVLTSPGAVLRFLLPVLVLSALPCNAADSLNMKQVAVLNRCLISADDPLSCGDANHNGLNEIYGLTPGSDSLVIFEHLGNNQYQRFCPPTRVHFVSGFGYSDHDSLGELVNQVMDSSAQDWIQILKSPDRHSFPSRVIFQTPHDGQYNHPIFMDLNGDGHQELVMHWGMQVRVFENAGGDSWYWAADIQPPGQAMYFDEFSVGDLDRDGHTEIVTGDYDNHDIGYVRVFEATGNDSGYVLRWTDTPGTYENFYACAPGDLDGNGWPEFLVLGLDTLTGEPTLLVYEAYGDNRYHRIWRGPFNWYGPMVAGDVDGDGVNEIVCAGGGATIYKCTGSHTYTPIWQFPDSGVGSMALYDLNGSGRAQIILALPDHTSIYEDAKSGIDEFTSGKPALPVQAPTIVRGPFRFGGLPEQSVVELYRADGELLQRQKVGQSASWTWDLTDQHGHRVPAGTYFAVVRPKGQSATTIKVCVVD